MTNPISDIEGCGAILLIGTNPTENHPIVGYRIRRAVKKGARLIVVDPRRIPFNPYHGDLVIAHEKYDVAVFYGVECLYADVALKIISLGTKCYTIALCGKLGHVDASITLRDTGIERIKKLTEIIRNVRKVKQEKAGVS